MQLAPNSTAIAFDSARRRAPPSGGGRHCSAARAASNGGDLRRPTHRSSTPKGGMDARAMGCCHAPACVRVRTQPPCLFCACAIGRPALSRPRGDRCRQTCVHAIVAAVRSFGTSPARCAGVTRCVLPLTRCSAPHPCRPPPWHRLRPRALAPLCVGEAAGMAAALR